MRVIRAWTTRKRSRSWRLRVPSCFRGRGMIYKELWGHRGSLNQMSLLQIGMRGQGAMLQIFLSKLLTVLIVRRKALKAIRWCNTLSLTSTHIQILGTRKSQPSMSRTSLPTVRSQSFNRGGYLKAKHLQAYLSRNRVWVETGQPRIQKYQESISFRRTSKWLARWGLRKTHKFSKT